MLSKSSFPPYLTKKRGSWTN